MERLLFKKIHVWIVALIVMLLLIVMFAFSVIVLHQAYGSDRFGAVGRFSLAVASLPANAYREMKMLVEGDLAGMSTKHSDRFEGRSGWSFSESRVESELDGYLFFSRHDGDVGRHVFELVDLKTGNIEHRIDLDSSILFADAIIGPHADPENMKPDRFQARHPIALENGDMVVKGFYTPMVRMTPCGQTSWIIDEKVFHHAIERGPDGNFWSSTYIVEQNISGLPNGFSDPGIVKFSEHGEILFERSLAEVMIKEGLGYLFLSNQTPNLDPLHLNDVEPVFEDGPFWKRGDVFLSLRHRSTVMLYRPSSDKIVWWKQGPWLAQHDVDVINSTTISVYNNNAHNLYGGNFVPDFSQINYYDFATDTVSEPFKEALEAQDFRNEAEGEFTLLPDGHFYVSESESGRTLLFTPEGGLAIEHINRAKNGLIYHLGWSRYMGRDEGDNFLKKLKTASCG